MSVLTSGHALKTRGSIHITNVADLNALHAFARRSLLAVLPTGVSNFSYTVHPVLAPLELLLSFLQTHPLVATHIRELCIQGAANTPNISLSLVALAKVLQLTCHATHLTLR